MAEVDECVGRLTNVNIFKFEIKSVLLYIILIINKISLFADFNNMVI